MIPILLIWLHDRDEFITNFASVNTFILKLRMHKQMASNVSFGYMILNWRV